MVCFRLELKHTRLDLDMSSENIRSPEYYKSIGTDSFGSNGNLRCKQSQNCQKSKCKETLANTPTVNTIRIVSKSNIQPLEYYQWERLCGDCKEGYHTFLFDIVWKDVPSKKISLVVFDKVLKEATCANMTNNARIIYDQMLARNLQRRNEVKRDELEGQREYLKNCARDWNVAIKELSEALKEDQARRASYQIE